MNSTEIEGQTHMIKILFFKPTSHFLLWTEQGSHGYAIQEHCLVTWPLLCKADTVETVLIRPKNNKKIMCLVQVVPWWKSIWEGISLVDVGVVTSSDKKYWIVSCMKITVYLNVILIVHIFPFRIWRDLFCITWWDSSPQSLLLCCVFVWHYIPTVLLTHTPDTHVRYLMSCKSQLPHFYSCFGLLILF